MRRGKRRMNFCMMRVKNTVPKGFRGALGATESGLVRGALKAAVEAGARRDIDSTSALDSPGTSGTHVSTRVDTHVDSEPEDDGSNNRRDGGTTGSGPEYKSVATEQESLPRFDKWSANGNAADIVSILKTLIAAVVTALFHLVSSFRVRPRGCRAQPQSAKDVRSYLAVEKSRVKDHWNDTYKPAHDALCKKIEEAGVDREAFKCYEENNYCVMQVIPVWLCCLIERFRQDKSKADFKEQEMFRKTYGEEVTYDSSRTLVDCSKCGVMWLLISCMVTISLAKHGLLMVVGASFTRVARVVTYIASKAVGSKVQAWHEDFCNAMAGYFGHEFGFSVLVSCLGDSVVDVIEKTYGQQTSETFEKENFVQIRQKQGQALIMGSGLRHRGMKYTKRNVRLFIAFVAEKSSGALFGATYNVQTFVLSKLIGKKRKGG